MKCHNPSTLSTIRAQWDLVRCQHAETTGLSAQPEGKYQGEVWLGSLLVKALVEDAEA